MPNDNEYTPTTGAVRVRYIKSEPGYDPPLIPSDPDYEEAGAEFDRWLAAHDREVAEKAWDDDTDQLTQCACECHERSREQLIALASSWSGWCTDNDQTLPKLAELGGFLLEVKHRMAMDREEAP